MYASVCIRLLSNSRGSGREDRGRAYVRELFERKRVEERRRIEAVVLELLHVLFSRHAHRSKVLYATHGCHDAFVRQQTAD